LDAVAFMKLVIVDSDKNHIALININQSYEEKKIDSRKGKRQDDSREDSDFQRNSKLEQSAVDPAVRPSKLSRRLPSNRSDDFFYGWIPSGNNECGR
jgi:hypothetical protein